MSRPALPRLPVAPLLEALQRRELTMRGFARDKGLCDRHVYNEGGLDWRTADKFAIALGFHPSDLWGDAWWAVARAYEDHALAQRERRLERDRVWRRRERGEEPPGVFCGRALVSPRWDPLHSTEHVCAVDGCGCWLAISDQEVA